MNINSLGISGSSSQFSIAMSQIEIELSSLATAMTDSQLGWNLIDVMGSVCQLKLISSWEWAFYFCFRKSQTFTEQSSDPVTIRFGVVLLQSQTFTSLSWALIRSWDFFKSPTLKSTICSVPSEEPTLNKFYMKQRQSVSWGKTQYPQRILCDSYKPHFWTKKYMFDCYRKLTLTQAYFLTTAVRFCEGSNSKQNLPIYFAGQSNLQTLSSSCQCCFSVFSNSQQGPQCAIILGHSKKPRWGSAPTIQFCQYCMWFRLAELSLQVPHHLLNLHLLSRPRCRDHHHTQSYVASSTWSDKYYCSECYWMTLAR